MKGERNMRRKLFHLFLGITMMTSLLAGCGDSKSEDKKSGGGKKEVTMMGWYTEENMKPILDKLNEKLGGEYTLEYTFVGLDDYNNVISTQLAAGEGPDILTDGANFPARIKAGNLEEITDKPYLEGFNEAGMTLCKDKEGKVYGIPSYGWFSGLWYNKDIFEENGIKDLPTTFDELVAVCDKLSANGVQPLGFGLAGGDQGMHSLLGYIENSFYEASEEGKSFDEKFAYGEAKMSGTLDSYVKEWSVLIDKGYITPEMVGISNDQALSDFIAGKTAMFNSGPWYYANFKEANLKVGMLPHLGKTADVKYLLGGPAASFGINKNAKNKAGAEAVLEALASVEVQQEFANANEGAFGYKEGVKVDLPEAYDTVRPILEAGNVACPWDRWGVNMPSQILVDEFIAQLQGVVTKELTIEDFLKAVDSKADSIRY